MSKPATGLTDPAVSVAAIVAAVVIAINPGQTLLILSGVEFVVAAGCAIHVGTSLRRTPPAPPSAALFAVLALFWLTMAGLSLWWYLQAG